MPTVRLCAQLQVVVTELLLLSAACAAAWLLAAWLCVRVHAGSIAWV